MSDPSRQSLPFPPVSTISSPISIIPANFLLHAKEKVRKGYLRYWKWACWSRDVDLGLLHLRRRGWVAKAGGLELGYLNGLVAAGRSETSPPLLPLLSRTNSTPLSTRGNSRKKKRGIPELRQEAHRLSIPTCLSSIPLPENMGRAVARWCRYACAKEMFISMD